MFKRERNFCVRRKDRFRARNDFYIDGGKHGASG